MTHPLDDFRLIDKPALERMITRLKKTRDICRSAVSKRKEEDDIHLTYAGASGHAAGSIECVLFTLEHLIDGAKIHE